MVVMRARATALIGTTQERTGWPSICTVQAPHSPAPHPNFVPVRSRLSRRTHKSGVSPSTLTVFCVPLMVKEKVIAADLRKSTEHSLSYHQEFCMVVKKCSRPQPLALNQQRIKDEDQHRENPPARSGEG